MTLNNNNENNQLPIISIANYEAKLDYILSKLDALSGQIRVLTDTLAVHVKNNIETTAKLQEWVNDQIAYRLFREEMEENRLKLEIAEKNIEIKYLSQQIGNLTEENHEADQLRMKLEKQNLEMDKLTEEYAMLKNAKQNTTDRMKAAKPKTDSEELVMSAKKAAVTALVTSLILGTGAFIYWLLRLYIVSNP